MAQVQAQEIEIPETWDTIKYEKPIHLTYSRGKTGKVLYCHNKYHCYGVLHEKPFYDLTPYRATGFGFAERSLRYVPLTHIQDRTNPKPQEAFTEKPRMKKIYESSLDSIWRKNHPEIFESEQRVTRELPSKVVLSTEIVGTTRYRTHVISRTINKFTF